MLKPKNSISKLRAAIISDIEQVKICLLAWVKKCQERQVKLCDTKENIKETLSDGIITLRDRLRLCRYDREADVINAAFEQLFKPIDVNHFSPRAILRLTIDSDRSTKDAVQRLLDRLTDLEEIVKADLNTEQVVEGEQLPETEQPTEGSGEKDTSEILIGIQKHIQFFRNWWNKFCQIVERDGEQIEKSLSDPSLRIDLRREESLDAKCKKIADNVAILCRQFNEASQKGDRKTMKRLDTLLKKQNQRFEEIQSQVEGPPKPGYVRYSNFDYQYLNLPLAEFPCWVQPDATLLSSWKFYLGNPRADLTDTERLIYDCALLSIFHDETTEFSEPKVYRHDDYKEHYFKRDAFAADLAQAFKDANAIEKIQRAWERVKTHLPKEPAEPKPTKTSSDESETEIKNRFSFSPGQISYAGRDLDLSTGLTIEVLKKLIDKFGQTVLYKDLDENSSRKQASEHLREAVVKIRGSFKENKVPCEVKNKSREGYVISILISPQTTHK